MGSTISRNPGLSRWYTGQVVENAAKGGADDWTYHWISLKVLSLEDILQAVQASRPFGKLIPQDRIHDVVRVSQQDARRLGEILTGPNGVEANTLLCAPGLKLNPSSRGEAHGLNIFDEYKTKDKRKSDGAFLADQYLRDDAVQTFKKETKRKGVQFHSWLSEQSGDHLSDLGTKFTDYAHEMWLKRQEGAPWLKPIENPDVYYKTQFENSEQLLKRSTDRHAKLGGQDSVQYYDRIEAERQAERQEAERQRAIDRSKRAQQGPLQGAGRSALQGASPIV